MDKKVNVNFDTRQLPAALRTTTINESAKMVETLLEQVGVRGQFLLHHREQRRMRGESNRIRVLKNVGNSVRLAIRPGDNSTCWEYDLKCPTPVDAARLFNQLRNASEQDTPENRPVPTRIPTPMQPGDNTISSSPNGTPTTETPIAATSRSTDDVLKLLAGAISRKTNRDQKLKILEDQRLVLVAEKDSIMGKIARIEEEQQGILQEDELDERGKAVTSLLTDIGKLLG